MQTCSKCSTQSPDSATHCVNCKADLSENSVTAVALKQLEANPRVQYIYVLSDDDCCPACREAGRAYAKGEVPKLPIEGCSHQFGCRCFYQPFLDEVYP